MTFLYVARLLAARVCNYAANSDA